MSDGLSARFFNSCPVPFTRPADLVDTAAMLAVLKVQYPQYFEREKK